MKYSTCNQVYANDSYNDEYDKNAKFISELTISAMRRTYKIRTKPDFLIWKASLRGDLSIPPPNPDWRKQMYPYKDDRSPIRFQNLTITHPIQKLRLQRDQSLQHPSGRQENPTLIIFLVLNNM